MTSVLRSLALVSGLVVCASMSAYAAPKAKPKAKAAPPSSSLITNAVSCLCN